MSKKDDLWIGFDLGGTKMLAMVFDDSFKCLGKSKKKTRGNRGQEDGLDRMVEVIEEAIEDAGVDSSRIRGIGVGCPGPIDPADGTIVEAPNLGWVNVPVEIVLTKKFGCPTVICNDVDAGVFAEYQFGAGRGSNSVVGIFPGTGIGAGAVLGGKLLQGTHLSCMELGHIPLYPETSGNGEATTTLEIECSRLKIAADAALAAYRGQAPHLLEMCGTDVSNITSGKLARAIELGDSAIEEIVKRAAVLLGNGVATVVHILAPDTIVLGGGLVEAMPELYLENVRKSARERVLRPFKDKVHIVTAELEDDAGVKGSAAWARQKIEAA